MRLLLPPLAAVVAGLSALCCAAACTSTPPRPSAATDPFLAEAQAQVSFERLRAQAAAAGGAAAPAAPLSVPPGETVSFASGDVRLTARVVAPLRMPAQPAVSGERLPALLYVPGDTEPRAVQATVAAVVDAGHVVMVAPPARAAAPGFGAAIAVEDLLAATRALADQPDVDASRLAVFGEGSGGPLAALLAVVADVPFTTFIAGRVDGDSEPVFLPHVEELSHPLLLLVPPSEAARARRAQVRAAAVKKTVDVRLVEDADAARSALVFLLRASPPAVALLSTRRGE